MKEFSFENAPAYAASRRESEQGKKVIWRVRPRFEAGYVLVTRNETQDMNDPAEVADVLRETAADAETLRDTLNDWIEGQYGIAENDNGELESLREIVGNMSIVMSNAAHVLEKSAAGVTWMGLNAEAMAAILDDLWGAGTFDNEQWDDWFKMYGSPYRVMPSPVETIQSVHWAVTAIPDDSDERITMGLFHVKSDAQAYAKTLGEDWEPLVTSADKLECLIKHPTNITNDESPESDAGALVDVPEEEETTYWHVYRDKDGEIIPLADFNTAEQAGHYADALIDKGMDIRIELIES